MNGTRRSRRRVSGIMLLDKPLGWSSNQALQQVKRWLNADKAGHTGSLDPLATGMLPLCFGEATKLAGYMLEADKTYLAGVQFGSRTSTGDAEGEVVEVCSQHLTAAEIEAVLPRFRGDIEQIPPMYSALKRDGKPLYTLAREGIEVVREPRRVRIESIELVGFDPAAQRGELAVTCAKGTYIRVLAEDLARAAGNCAHLCALRRSHVEPFGSWPMVTVGALQAAFEQGGSEALDGFLQGPLAALAHWPQIAVDAQRADWLAHGQAVRRPAQVELPLGLVAVVDAQGVLLGIAESNAEGNLMPRRWLCR